MRVARRVRPRHGRRDVRWPQPQRRPRVDHHGDDRRSRSRPILRVRMLDVRLPLLDVGLSHRADRDGIRVSPNGATTCDPSRRWSSARRRRASTTAQHATDRRSVARSSDSPRPSRIEPPEIGRVRSAATRARITTATGVSITSTFTSACGATGLRHQAGDEERRPQRTRHPHPAPTATNALDDGVGDLVRRARQRCRIHARRHASDDETGPHQHQLHAAAVQGIAQSAREPVESGLGGPVHVVRPADTKSGDRREHHDPTRAGVPHQVRQHGEDADLGHEIGVDHVECVRGITFRTGLVAQAPRTPRPQHRSDRGRRRSTDKRAGWLAVSSASNSTQWTATAPLCLHQRRFVDQVVGPPRSQHHRAPRREPLAPPSTPISLRPPSTSTTSAAIASSVADWVASSRSSLRSPTNGSGSTERGNDGVGHGSNRRARRASAHARSTTDCSRRRRSRSRTTVNW